MGTRGQRLENPFEKNVFHPSLQALGPGPGLRRRMKSLKKHAAGREKIFKKGAQTWHAYTDAAVRPAQKAVIKSAASAASAAARPEAVIKSAASTASPRAKKSSKNEGNQSFLYGFV